MQWSNPVLNRELLEELRRPRAFLLLALFLAMLAGVVLIAWPPHELTLQESKSRQIYNTFALGQAVLLALLAPVLSAPAFAAERERRTLDLLFTTPLSPAALVAGKLLSAVAYLLLLAVAGLPVLSLCFVLGGINPYQVAGAYALLFGFGFLCGAVGLTASVLMERSRNALAVSYAAVLPLVLFVVVLNPMPFPGRTVALGGLSVAAGAALLLLAHRRLRGLVESAPKASEEEVKEEQVGLVLDARRFPDRYLFPASTGRPLDERANPVYAKELRHELFGRGTLLVRVLLQFSLVAALPFFVAMMIDQSFWLYGFYVLVFVMLLGPSLTAGLFTQERERGTLDLLLTTALPARAIIGAKLVVSLRNMAILTGFLLAPLALLWGLCLLLGEEEALDLLRKTGWFDLTAGFVAVTASSLLLVVSLSALLSLVSRTTLRSMVLSYLAVALLFLAPLVLYISLTGLGNARVEPWQWMLVPSPFYTVAAFDSMDAWATRIGALHLWLPAGAGERQLPLFLLFSLGLSGLCIGLIYLLFPRYAQYRHDRGL